jgi:hypothetical protein
MGGGAASTLAMAGAAEQGATNTSTNGMMGGTGSGAGPKDQSKHDVKLWSDDDIFSAGKDTAPSVIT